jgi:hypothetical protein
MLSELLFALVVTDPPGRAARLGYFEGPISFRPASVDDWTDPNSNYPLTTGDELWAADGSQGEIHVGNATVLRLGAGTAFSFLDLDDDTTQVRVSEGSLAVTVHRLYPDEVVEVDTPQTAISLLRPGFYRIDVDERGDQTRLTVRDGEAEAATGGGAVPVYAREAIVLSGGPDSPSYDLRDPDAPDAWERWCLERDQREERLEARRYVPDGMVGYTDLDEYGSWRDSPDYGRVWVPRDVAADWAPYRYGRWSWVSPWGWTWIDDAPWGFAPFHYGRWTQLGSGWAWVPGSSVARPIYAPALVGFIGDVTSAQGAGSLAWFPLGPREVYVPSFRASQGYIRSVNLPYVPNIAQVDVSRLPTLTNAYANLNLPGAVTAVDSNVFATGQPVAKAAVVVPPQQARRAKLRPTIVESVKPRRESVVGATARAASAPKPPDRVRQRKVVVRASPPPPPPRIVGEGRVAPAPPPPIRPAVQGAQGANLRPTREGIRAPRPIRAGERPRARERAREAAEAAPKPSTASPSPRAPEPTQREREIERTREKDREQERLREHEREQERLRERAREEERLRERAREQERLKEREREAEQARERQRELERARRQPPPTPPPAARPEPAKPAPKPPSAQKERTIQRERSPQPPSASPTPAPSKRPPDQPRERTGERERKRPKPRPTPTPTPTPPPAG